MAPKQTNKINFITGEKGGGGKSFYAKAMVQYALDRKHTFTLIETDRSNPDVSNVYPNFAKFAVFKEDESELYKADSIFEHATKGDVIVSLPSQVHRAMTKWMERSNLLEIAPEYKVQFYNWFVCTGRYDSVNLLKNSLNYYQNRMSHVLVRNWGFCDDWSHLDKEKDLQKLLKKYKVKIIDFPRLELRETFLIDQHRLNFGQALKSTDITILGRQRIKNFLSASYQAIDSAGVWNES